MYIRILKAIYSMIESELLWYELYASVINDMEFQINPYDMCMVKIYINGKQCTIDWYIDNNKVLHVEQEVIYDVINKVEVIFLGLMVREGNTHTLLGTNIRYVKNKKVAINMKEYILEDI